MNAGNAGTPPHPQGHGSMHVVPRQPASEFEQPGPRSRSVHWRFGLAVTLTLVRARSLTAPGRNEPLASVSE
jgi:hypothetical protein